MQSCNSWGLSSPKSPLPPQKRGAGACLPTCVSCGSSGHRQASACSSSTPPSTRRARRLAAVPTSWQRPASRAAAPLSSKVSLLRARPVQSGLLISIRQRHSAQLPQRTNGFSSGCPPAAEAAVRASSRGSCVGRKQNQACNPAAGNGASKRACTAQLLTLMEDAPSPRREFASP